MPKGDINFIQEPPRRQIRLQNIFKVKKRQVWRFAEFGLYAPCDFLLVQGPRKPDEIETSYWKEMLVDLDKEKKSLPISLMIILVFFLLNVLAFVLTRHYDILWILSSLLFCVFSVLFIIMPTTRRTNEQEPLEPKAHIDTTSILEHKKVLGLAFWNSYFINSQPMAFGTIALFLIDVPLVVYLTIISQVLTLEVAGLLLLQAGGMILFYVGIIRLKPYEGGFLEEVWSVERSVAGALRGRSVMRFRTVFFTALFISVFVASLVSAMLMPGSTFKALRGGSNIDLAQEVLPLVLIFISQFLLVRETQSVASRGMAESLLRKKLSLRNEQNAPKERGIEGLEAEMPAYFKVTRHDILGYMPVYMMVPDLSVIFSDETAKR